MAENSFVRNLTFHSQDLGQETTLVLAFDSQPMKGIYHDYFPTAWKVSTFQASGPSAIVVTYKSQLCFVKPQVDSSDVIISASTWVDINPGQSTQLTEADTYHFSPPESDQPKDMIAYNKTGAMQGIGIGFNDGKVVPPPTTLYWDKVGSGLNVIAQFTPVLHAYISSEYQENKILRGAIQGSIWSQDLGKLPETSTFTLSRDEVTGAYTITQDS